MALAILAAAIIVPASLLAWGPDRKTFTYEHPAPYVTFNSITDNPKIGDERNFVRIRELTSGSTFSDNVTVKAGKTYEVMVFYHNNAASNLNDSGVGIAKNVTARVQMTGVLKSGEKATITGFIDSSNANPTSVWDNAYATSSDGDYALRYVPDSAKIASSNGKVNGAKLSSNLLSTGVKLGYDSLDGVLPGCNKYSGYITFQFVADKPDFTIQKQVSVDGGKTWVENATANPGTTILYKMVYTNTGTMQQNDVVLKDQLPKNVTYVAGSSLIANSKTGGKYVSTKDGVTSSGGYNLGSYAPKGNAYFKFSAKIASESSLSCGANELTNTAIINTANGGKSDTAKVTVTKKCAPAEVKYTCDALTATKLSQTSFRFNTDYTLQNATFKTITYVVRDINGKEIETKTVTGKTFDYSQSTVGKYSVQSTVNVTVNGANKSATSEGCKANFEVTSDTTPVIPPTIPAELPTTGAGQGVAAVLGLGTLITSAGYYIASRRLFVNL
jgi:uncharacterized repeat protein (TIGR01451 family)/LPXTG-motif cell wall-anchored protein